MTRLIGLEASDAEARGAGWTATEIAQQPDTLRKTADLIDAVRPKLDAFLRPLLDRSELRIVLAGAGTSAFIGDSLAPLLSAIGSHRIEAVATTDIVSVPQIYLEPTRPTLLVSFGRSGNSPESIAAVELADQLVDEVSHLIITCNPDGALARYSERSRRAFAIVLPEETHDRSFAMTSSFTAMLYAALATLGGQGAAPIEAVATAVAAMQDGPSAIARTVAGRNVERVAYIGSGGLTGVARESALKMLEMTDGTTVTMHDSALGFRHGPKAFLNSRTTVVLFVSNHAYTRHYDLDLLDELLRERTAARVIAITARAIDHVPSDAQLIVPDMAEASDLSLIFPYVVFAQMLAVWQALALGKTPDDPNPSGIVNRVVQGVRIHAIA